MTRWIGAMAVGRRRRLRRRGAATIWKVPEELWNRIAILFPIEEFRPTGGRPWTPPRRILDGVLYVLRTGCAADAAARLPPVLRRVATGERAPAQLLGVSS